MSGTARLTPFRVHVADQILAALTEAAPLPLSTMAVEDRTGYGRGLVYQMLIRLASAGDVDKVAPRGIKPCFWRARPADGHHHAEVA
jgi:hypothetical protein